MIGISVDTLNNYKKLTKLILELEENWHKKMRKIILDKLGKWCYDFINDKDYKSCQLQLSNKQFEFPVCVHPQESLEKFMWFV